MTQNADSGAVIKPWLCHRCGLTIREHKVYQHKENIPRGARLGKFDVWTRGLYCPSSTGSLAGGDDAG